MTLRSLLLTLGLALTLLLQPLTAGHLRPVQGGQEGCCCSVEPPATEPLVEAPAASGCCSEELPLEPDPNRDDPAGDDPAHDPESGCGCEATPDPDPSYPQPTSASFGLRSGLATGPAPQVTFVALAPGERGLRAPASVPRAGPPLRLLNRVFRL